MPKQFDTVVSTMKALSNVLKPLNAKAYKALSDEEKEEAVADGVEMLDMEYGDVHPNFVGLSRKRTSFNDATDDLTAIKKAIGSAGAKKYLAAMKEMPASEWTAMQERIVAYSKLAMDVRACAHWFRNIQTNKHTFKDFTDDQRKVAREAMKTLGMV